MLHSCLPFVESRTRENLSGWRTFFWIEVCQLENQRGLFWHLIFYHFRKNLLLSQLEVSFGSGMESSEIWTKFKQDKSNWVHVYLFIIRFLCELLRTEVEWGAYLCWEKTVFLVQIKDLLDRLRGSLLFPLAVILDRQTEISNLNYILGIDEDVERFEISVDDVLTVDIFNALNNLRKVMEVELPVNLTS